MKRWLSAPFLRSVQGQLVLLAGTYTGAVVLAILAVGLRSVFFDRYVRETFPAPSERVLALMNRVAHSNGPLTDRDSEAIRELSGPELEAAYGAWLNTKALDPRGRVTMLLLWPHSAFMIKRIRITCIAGSLAQQARALELLARDPDRSTKDEALSLCQFLRERAHRRGEGGLRKQADEALHQLRFRS